MQSNFKVVVLDRKPSAQRIVTLTLANADGSKLPSWSVGAHIDVQVFDKSGLPSTRQYSLCGKREDHTWTIAVLDEENGRGGSRWLHKAANIGSQLTVSMPRNNFRLHDGNAPTVLVAGGIGITPILAMARELQARGEQFSLHYFARTRESAAFLDEIQTSEIAPYSSVFLDDETGGTRTTFASSLPTTLSESHLYVCGPEGFMDAICEELISKGLSPDRVHRELFASSQREVPHCKAKPFEIQLRSDGRVIEVAETATAVQALAAAGIDVVVSCEQGLCGSCLTHVIEGIPDHRDQFLLPEERERNDCFTPCCSRAVSARLVLDL